MARNLNQNKNHGSSRGVIVEALPCGFYVNEFESSHVHNSNFQANTLREAMNSLILRAMN